MRIALLALALAGGAVGAASPAMAQTPVERLREACLSTHMQREPFDRLIGARGLEPLIPVLHEGETPPAEWSTGYGDGPVQIVMSGPEADPANATDCGVLSPTPAGEWRAEVEALARELHMQPATPDGLANVVEARSWAGDDGRPLTLSYEVYSQVVVVRFARPAAGSQ